MIQLKIIKFEKASKYKLILFHSRRKVVKEVNSTLVTDEKYFIYYFFTYLKGQLPFLS